MLRGKAAPDVMLDGREDAGMRTLTAKSWVWALVALLAALLFQFSVVRLQYGGEWTGLFHSGLQWQLPNDLPNATFRHTESPGYDGQFYRLAAHDPFNLKGYSEYMDNAVYRRKRVLIPLLAWALGLGHAAWIDTAYIAVINLFVFLGAWLLADLARSWSKRPAWGLAFLFVPATLNSIDRMLPDLALIAAMAGFLLYRERRPAVAWAFLASAVLVRDLGLLVLAAAVGQLLWRRRWVPAFGWAAAAAPGLAWWAFCSGMATPLSNPPPTGWLAVAPGYGFFLRIAGPASYNTSFDWLFQILDALVMLSLPAAAVASVWLWWGNRDGSIEWQALAGSSLAILASHPVFLGDSASYPRAFSLLVCPLAMIALRTGRWIYALPCALLSLRLVLALGGILLRAAAASPAG
ncbi:MAG TPA: hypothetical protein PKJ41_10030 [Bryobacteraceae bacterium]|nr:hypothetical protein [Bryobacteraceae bacterium]